MLRFAPAFAALLIGAPALAQDLPGPRPMDQMRGDCAAFALDVSREAALWATTAEPLTAGAEPTAAPVLAAGTLGTLTLLPHGEVAFAVAPEQDRGAPDRFSGHLRLTVPQAGLWRVAASNGLWYDAVADGAIVHSAAFEMQTQCAAPFKVVVFDLPAGEVSLQFNGSPASMVQVVALPWSQN